MLQEAPIAVITALSKGTLGVFRGCDAVAQGVSRKQLNILCRDGFAVRALPDTYRIAAVAACEEQQLRLALSWAGSGAVGWGRSAGATYRLEGVSAPRPEIIVPRDCGARTRAGVIVARSNNRDGLMVRRVRGIPVTGIEATLMALAGRLGSEALEVACEDARRRNLTGVPALVAYLNQHSGHGRSGAVALRHLVRQLDPAHPSRSKLEVLTRRLLVANGLGGYTREFPLTWNGRTYYFDFAYERGLLIVETNGRRFHDDATDYEYDQEKWSVPARYGYRIVFATWRKVNDQPLALCAEVGAALEA
jgi:hypothetical protein